MAIKKRKTIPDPSLQADFSRRDDEHAGRSPELQGLRYDVWQFVRDNPNCTRDDVARGLAMKSSTATARIKELIDLGYIVEPPGVRRMNKSGVRAKTLVLSDRKAGGVPNERVRVEVQITIDHNGTYGARAHVVHGLPQHGNVAVVMRKVLTLTLPPTETFAESLEEEKAVPVTRLELQLGADQIIDVDYEILDVDQE